MYHSSSGSQELAFVCNAARAVRRGAMHMCMWMPPLAAWRVVRLICVTNEKKHLSHNPLATLLREIGMAVGGRGGGAFLVAPVTACRHSR